MIRKWLVHTIATLILILVALIAAFAVVELYLRMTDFNSRVFHQRCLSLNGSDLKQTYVPNCTSVIFVNKEKIVYSFNEDGLRDRGRRFFGKNVILTLGDSIVKGLSLQKEQTIPSILEFRLHEKLGVQFLNGGIRLSSPTTQSLLATKLIDLYPIRGVLWFINGSDVFDERLAHALADEWDENGVPVRFRSDPLTTRLGGAARFMRLISLESNALALLIRIWRYHSWTRELSAVAKKENVLCGGIERLARELKARQIPLMFVVTPHSRHGIEASWGGLPFDTGDLETMKQCARRTGAIVEDLTSLAASPDWYQPDGMHFRASGTLAVAERVGDRVIEWLGSGRL